MNDNDAEFISTRLMIVAIWLYILESYELALSTLILYLAFEAWQWWKVVKKIKEINNG